MGRSRASATRRPRTSPTTVAAASLRDVWVALRASMRTVLEAATLADVAAGKLPAVRAQAPARPGGVDAPLMAAPTAVAPPSR